MIGLLLSLVMAIVCILLHFEALMLVQRLRERMDGHRTVMIAMWMILLTVHVLQVWLFAIAYVLGCHWQLGELVEVDGFLDYVYFSAIVYTTVGFGDIVPTGDLRMLAACEGLVGLCLIAWSATATFGIFSRWSDGR